MTDTITNNAYGGLVNGSPIVWSETACNISLFRNCTRTERYTFMAWLTAEGFGCVKVGMKRKIIEPYTIYLTGGMALQLLSSCPVIMELFAAISQSILQNLRIQVASVGGTSFTGETCGPLGWFITRLTTGRKFRVRWWW